MTLTHFGKFKLIKKIAQGGMAEIFLSCVGEVQDAYKFVIIKKVLSAQSQNKEFKKMFQNEGKIAINLNHSNLASIYEFGLEKQQYFICMEYIAGRNVRQLVKKLQSKKIQLDVEHIAYIIRNTCLGLDYAHNYTDKLTGNSMNIIHRDVSPQNIMVSFNGEIKLIDFGIAKVDNSEATRVGTLKGKFEYMSPEQVRGRPLNGQTDIFSTGSVLWELLAGRKLFTANDEIQVMKKIKQCQVPDLQVINPNIPTKIVEITNKALHPNKNLRYKTAAEMANDISFFLSNNYPNFTQVSFSQFIKDLYVEEILEDRKFLIECTKLLNEHAKKQQTVSSFVDLPHTVTATRQSNDQTLNSDKKTAIPTMTYPEQDYDQYTSTKRGSRKNRLTQITRTKFDDPLDINDQHTNINRIKLIDNQNVETHRKKKSAYNPYYDTKKPTIVSQAKSNVSGITSSRLTNSKISKKRSATASFATFIVLIFAVSGSLVYFVKSGAIKIPEKGFFSQFQQKPKKITAPLANKKKKLVKNPPHRQTPVVKKSVEEKQKADRMPANVVKTREIHITTNPSRAYIRVIGHNISEITPVTIKLPTGKDVTVVIEKQGHQSKRLIISPSSIEDNAIHIMLKKRKGVGDEAIIL